MADAPASTTQAFAVVTGSAYLKPGQLVSLDATNANAAARYIQIWDRNAALAGGEVGTGPTPYGNAVPATTANQLRVVSFLIPAGTAAAPGRLTLPAFFFAGMERFDLGLVYGFSSAAQTYTAGTAADHTLTLRWRAAG